MRTRSNMIHELKSSSPILYDEKQIQALVRSFHDKWEHLKVNTTHNDNIKTFSDVICYVELEDERLGAAKFITNTYMVESNSKKALGFKHDRNWKKNKKGKNIEEASKKKNLNLNYKNKCKRFGKKKDKSKIKYYNCQAFGRFTHDALNLKMYHLIRLL